MNFGLLDTLNLLGALGFFIYGMKIMSESIQKVAGSKMRQFLRAMTSNRLKGVATGFLITSLVQSSSATTVLVVSFVNAGLLSLIESIGVIMGANIGTTITAWLISIIGFKVSISKYSLLIIAIGFPMIFLKRERIKSWGEVLIGFALLFMGLSFLKDAVPDLKSNPEILAFLSQYTDLGILSVLIFVLIGTLITVVVQSSSAAMALTLVMANNGWIPFEIAASLVLGENIGTTITANLAAIVGNIHAKRAAFAHFIFNVFGVIWIIILMKPFLSAINYYIVSSGGFSPLENPEAIPVALSIFHTSFNIINTLILVWFARFIAKVVTRVIKGNEDDEFKLKYISTGLMDTDELSVEQAKKETKIFGEVISKMNDELTTFFTSMGTDQQGKSLRMIKKLEEHTDLLDEEITKYLQEISGPGSLSQKASERVSEIYNATNELETTGDLYYQLAQTVNKRLESGVILSDKQKGEILEMLELLKSAVAVMNENLSQPFDKASLELARNREVEINKKRIELLNGNSKEFSANVLDPMGGTLFKDIIYSLEKIGDHLVGVTEAVVGPEIEHIGEEVN